MAVDSAQRVSEPGAPVGRTARIGALLSRATDISRSNDAAWCARSLRQAGRALVALSVIEGASTLIPGVATSDRPLVVVGVELLLGLAALLLPPGRMARRACLGLALAVLVVIAVAGATGSVPTGSNSVVLILLFVWGGSWQSPWTALRLAPLAAVASYSPWLFDAGSRTSNGAGLLVVVPAAVVVGEALARQGNRLARTEAERARAVLALAEAAVTDELTGVGNYRRARQLLEDLRPGDGLAVLDLDRFKTVNDRFGHAEGDRLLQRMGQFLLQSTRGFGNVARIGGEEFIVVLPGAGIETGPAVGRLLREWRELDPLTTVSAGACVIEVDGDGQAGFESADAALYRAKERGRDCLELAA